MKKLSFLLLSLMAVTLLTACGSDNEPVNKQTVSSVINNRVIDGDAVAFSQTSAKIELNYTDMTIQFTSEYRDIDGHSHTITTPEMPMKLANNAVYSFSNMSAATATDVENFQGKLDTATGMLLFSFNQGSSRVVSTSHLLYAYTTTTMTNPENGNHGSHQMTSYLFAIDTRGESCVMQLRNFVSTLSGNVDVAEVRYDGLTLTPTLTGYTITADKAESNFKGFYTITDLSISINDQCNVINGSFMCNGIKHEISGGLFGFNSPI